MCRAAQRLLPGGCQGRWRCRTSQASAARALPYFFGAMLTVSVALVPSTVKVLVPTPTQMSFTSPGEEGKEWGRRDVDHLDDARLVRDAEGRVLRRTGLSFAECEVHGLRSKFGYASFVLEVDVRTDVRRTGRQCKSPSTPTEPRVPTAKIRLIMSTSPHFRLCFHCPPGNGCQGDVANHTPVPAAEERSPMSTTGSQQL